MEVLYARWSIVRSGLVALTLVLNKVVCWGREVYHYIKCDECSTTPHHHLSSLQHGEGNHRLTAQTIQLMW